MQPTNLFQWTLSAMLWPAHEQTPSLMSDELSGEWFDAFNDSRMPATAMDAETAEGYLTACFLGLELPTLATSLTNIFGKDELPLCDDLVFQERLLKLTYHRWHDIQVRLGQDLPTEEKEAARIFLPSWTELDAQDIITPYRLDEHGFRVGAWKGKAWARGFLERVREDPAWEYLISDQEQFHLMASLVLLDQGFNPEKRDLQIDANENLTLLLVQSLYEIRGYWKKNRRAALAYVEQLEDEELSHIPYFREAPKIGRNDPCPCGSGKKYKKCCGA